MYLDYFSLNRHPFRITPDPSLFFPGGVDGRGVILNALIYGITSGEGILKVVGEVGSGKTMLCRMLEEQLPDNIEIVYIANPSLSAREILYAIAIELRLDVTSSTERLKVLHLIQNYLLDKHGKGGSVVVFVEEAQSMPLETLEEIRLLSNLETHQHKLLQIVLFGQPELDKILAQKNIRQLRERITHSFRLEPLSAQATSEYIRYRLKVAGSPRAQLFSSRAEKMIAKASSGLTRRINILADKALLAAYADSPSRQPAQDSNEPLVLPRHARAAIRDSDYRKKIASPWLLGGLGAAVVVMAGAYVVLGTDLIRRESVPVLIPAQADNAVVPPENPLPAPELPETEVSVQSGVIARDIAPQADSDSPRAAALIASTAETAAVEAAVVSAQSEGAVAPAAPANTAQEPELTTEPQAVQATPEPALQAPETGQQTGSAAVVAAPTVIEADNETPPTTAPPAPPPVAKSPVTMVPSGLAELRMAATAKWLSEIGNKAGYTIVLFSVPSTNPNGLEEYLQFLQLVSLLDETYICFKPISSPTSGRWQVMHREFQGVTPARNLLRTMPEYIRQYNPYVSNLGSIQCSYPVAVGN